jgi:pimeloyl-ACP methyl ester carboxylesterase
LSQLAIVASRHHNVAALGRPARRAGDARGEWLHRVALWLLARRRRRPNVVEGWLEIGVDAIEVVESSQDVVAGRSLQYLEAKRGSDDLFVFLHGLGLDASDFRPYMAESGFHCVALTLYGFNAHERGDERYQPISLKSHVQLLAYALRELRSRYPGKKISLVGFSFGADVIFFLSEYAPGILRDLDVRGVLLLDPNVDRSTTTISSKVAVMDGEQPLTQLLRILESADNIAEFRYLCLYLSKILAKNFAQIQRHAREVVAKWAVQSQTCSWTASRSSHRQRRTSGSSCRPTMRACSTKSSAVPPHEAWTRTTSSVPVLITSSSSGRHS